MSVLEDDLQKERYRHLDTEIWHIEAKPSSRCPAQSPQCLRRTQIIGTVGRRYLLSTSTICTTHTHWSEHTLALPFQHRWRRLLLSNSHRNALWIHYQIRNQTNQHEQTP